MVGKRKYILGLLIIISHVLFAQSDDFETIMSNGISDFGRGHYDEALTWFNQAYKLDKGSNKVCYELATTHLALNNNEDAVIYSGKILVKGGGYKEDAILINGSAWENIGRRKRAQKIYRQGIKEYPDSYLMHYNLALSLFKDKDYDNAQKYTIKAIELYSAHASSHLLLSYIMFDKGERIKSMLPLYYFLLIEQDSERTTTAYDLLSTLWDQGVRKNGQREIQLVNAGFQHSEFGKAELAVSLIRTSELSNSEDEASSLYNNRLINFAQNNKTFFKILAESSNDKYGFWWEFYVNFFTKLEENNLSEPFSYFISSCRYNNDVLLWLSDNHQEFERFTAWMEVQ